MKTRVLQAVAGLLLAAAVLVGIGPFTEQHVALTPEAYAQVTCPIGLPNATSFTGPTVTQGQFKTATTNLVSYLTCLFGTDGTAATAKSTLGLATVASTGNYNDLTNTPAAFPTSAVIIYAGSSPPTGWLFANGQCVSQTTYATLFAVIGNTYGTSCGTGNFQLPDLRGRFVAGVDNMGGIGAAGRLGSGATGGITASATLGATGGEQKHTQTLAELVGHGHTLSPSTNYIRDLGAQQSSGTSPGAGFFSISGAVDVGPQGGPSDFTWNAQDFSASVSSAGGGAAMNITPPALVLNYIIKTSSKRLVPANDNRWPAALAI